MKLKIQVLNILNRLFFFKNLELLRIIKNGHDKKYQALKTKKTYLDINGEISYVVDKRLNYNDKQIENYKLFLSKYILKQPVETIFNILLYENESKSQYFSSSELTLVTGVCTPSWSASQCIWRFDWWSGKVIIRE